MKGRRSLYELYWEILVFCREEHTFTSIINRCDLNSKKGQEYISFLQGKGYLEVTVKENHRTYETTVEGLEYIKLFNSLYRELFEKRPSFRL